MLTRLRATNFKQFDMLDVELGNPVVFIGPNDSGKTTALRGLALWGLGLTHWISRYEWREAPKRRPAVTLNRRDLIAIPVPVANQLWRDLHTSDVSQNSGNQHTKNIRIDVIAPCALERLTRKPLVSRLRQMAPQSGRGLCAPSSFAPPPAG
jgi:hypothetical protein